MNGRPDTLPPWLRLTYTAVSEFPTTNGIKITALILMYVTGGSLGVASLRSLDIAEGVLALWLGALLSMMGVAEWAARDKRRKSPDVEDLKAAQGTEAALAATVQTKDAPKGAP